MKAEAYKAFKKIMTEYIAVVQNMLSLSGGERFSPQPATNLIKPRCTHCGGKSALLGASRWLLFYIKTTNSSVRLHFYCRSMEYATESNSVSFDSRPILYIPLLNFWYPSAVGRGGISPRVFWRSRETDVAAGAKSFVRWIKEKLKLWRHSVCVTLEVIFSSYYNSFRSTTLRNDWRHNLFPTST